MSDIRQMDNVEFVKYLMTSGQCPTGALSQGFILDALGKMSKHVVDGADECMESMQGSFVNPEAWIETAAWIKVQLDLRYADKQKETKNMSKYYWKITGAVLGLVSEIGTVGPYNADETITENRGVFRMKDNDGTIYYHGEIYGDYDGFEPLDDYGMPNAGCTSIEYNEKGEWKQL